MSNRPSIIHILICLMVGAGISAYFVGMNNPVPFVAGMAGNAAGILLLMEVLKGRKRKPPPH